ncbi:hypothetical protein ACXYRQ_01295 [Mycoplasma sp. 394]
MYNLKSNYLVLQVFENETRKIIGFCKTYKKAKEYLNFNEYNIEILQVTTVAKNYGKKYEYKESQKDERSKRPF